jgi:hypothetical protein
MADERQRDRSQSTRPAGPIEPIGLTARLDRALDLPEVPEPARPFWRRLVLPERAVRAVLLYGSCLWPGLRTPSSEPDFMLVVDSLTEWHGRRPLRILSTILPPTVLRLRDEADAERHAKLSVVSFDELASQCGRHARDLHLAGRLCKRLGLLWAFDKEARARVVAAQASALRTFSSLALSRLAADLLSLDPFVEALLGLSCESELRVVERGEAKALFLVEREHYRAIGRCLLGEVGAQPSDTDDRFRVPAGAAASVREVDRRLRRSRRRALYRLPKYLVTYDGWLDYLLGKPRLPGDRRRLRVLG